jgi:hypothetical protein
VELTRASDGRGYLCARVAQTRRVDVFATENGSRDRKEKYNIIIKTISATGTIRMRTQRWEMRFDIYICIFFFNAPFTNGHQKQFKEIKK